MAEERDFKIAEAVGEAFDALTARFDELVAEVQELRQKVAAMEQQQPAANASMEADATRLAAAVAAAQAAASAAETGAKAAAAQAAAVAAAQDQRLEFAARETLATTFAVLDFGCTIGGDPEVGARLAWATADALHPGRELDGRHASYPEVLKVERVTPRAASGTPSGRGRQGGQGAGASGSGASGSGGSGAGAGGPRRPTIYKVTVKDKETALMMLRAKRKHADLKSGLVVRQWLTAQEMALQRARLQQFRDLKAAGTAVDWRRAALVRKVAEHWVEVPPPKAPLPEAPPPEVPPPEAPQPGAGGA